MKFDDLADSILKEDNARRSAAGLDMDGLMADEERYEKELDKKEAYKDNLLRRGEDQEDELISHLEKMSRVISNDDIEIEFVNIANKVLGLLKGVNPYSKNPPQLSPEQRQAAREIGGIILNRSDLV